MHPRNQLQQHATQDSPQGPHSAKYLEPLPLDPLMPCSVTLAEVLGFVEVLGENGFTIPISRGGGSKFFQGSSGFLLLISASQILGLVSRRGNRIILTDLGLGFLKADFPAKMGVLRARPSRIEPFISTLQVFSKRNSATIFKISKKLSDKYGLGNFDENQVCLVLIEWGLQTGMIGYDGSCEFWLEADQLIA